MKKKKKVLLFLLICGFLWMPLRTHAQTNVYAGIHPPTVGDRFEYTVWASSVSDYNLSMELYNNTDNVVVLERTTIKKNKDYTLSVSINNPTTSGPFGSLGFEVGKVLTPGEEFTIRLAANPSGTYHDTPGTYNVTYQITATAVNDNTKSTTREIPATIVIKKLPISVAYMTHVQDYGESRRLKQFKLD